MKKQEAVNKEKVKIEKKMANTEKTKAIRPNSSFGINLATAILIMSIDNFAMSIALNTSKPLF